MTKMTSRIALTTAIDTLSAIEGFDPAVVAKLTDMVSALDRKASKSSSAPHKPTAQQVENEAISTEILTMLEDGEKTIPQLMEGLTVDTKAPLTSQRVSAILTLLKREGSVIRCDGKTAVFALATTPVAEDVAE